MLSRRTRKREESSESEVLESSSEVYFEPKVRFKDLTEKVSGVPERYRLKIRLKGAGHEDVLLVNIFTPLRVVMDYFQRTFGGKREDLKYLRGDQELREHWTPFEIGMKKWDVVHVKVRVMEEAGIF